MGHYRRGIDEFADADAVRFRANHYVTDRDGSHDIDLRACARDGVRLHGRLTGIDGAGLVAAAGVFAFPSTKEGFGLAAMEALTARVPVVTRDLPVPREVFGGVARFATDPVGIADALFAAVTDDDTETRRAGSDLAPRHTWQAAAQRHLALYGDLLA